MGDTSEEDGKMIAISTTVMSEMLEHIAEHKSNKTEDIERHPNRLAEID